jgi:uncharacterized protein (DUF305 family)
MTVQHELMMQKLQTLFGAEFEIMFLKEMIFHHLSGVKDAERALKRAYHPELKMLAQNIISVQSAEIRQMLAWLCEWYSRCRPTRGDGS